MSLDEFCELRAEFKDLATFTLPAGKTMLTISKEEMRAQLEQLIKLGDKEK